MTHAPNSSHIGQPHSVPDQATEHQHLMPRPHQQPCRHYPSYGAISPPQHPALLGSSSDSNALPSPYSPSSRSTRSNSNPPSSHAAVSSNAIEALDLSTPNHAHLSTTADVQSVVTAEVPGRGRAGWSGMNQGGNNHRVNRHHKRQRRNTDTTVPTSPVSSFTLHNLPIPTSSSCYSFVAKHVPLLSWLIMRPGYNWKDDTVPDLFAGLSVAIVIIPQSVAYALLASLPPVYGLYTSLVPALVYSIFGTSKHMSPGTFAITSLLLGQSVHKILAEQGYPELPPSNNHLPGSNTNDNLMQNDYQQRYLSLCLMMTFMIGIIQVVLGFARLGRWISRSLVPTPLISGFNTASAFHIGTHQIKHLLGVHPPRFSGAFSMLRTWMWIMDEFYSKVAWPTLGLGVAAILTMIGLQRVEHWRRKRSTSAAVVATAPATSAQSLLTVQDVAIEQESRLGRHSIDSSLSSTSTSPSLSPIRDASLPTTNPPVAHNNTAPSSRHPSYQVYRGTETGLYNTGATHARPGIKPLNAANYSSNSTSRWPLWRQPQHSGGDHTFLPPGNYSAESAYRSLSDEDEYGLDDDDDEENFGMKDPRSPKDSVYGTSGQGELYIHVDKCQHSYGSCSGPRRAKSAEALSPPMSVSDRSESSHSASATQDIFTPSTAVPSSSIPSPWTTLLSGGGSPFHGKDGGDGHGIGPKELPIVHNGDQPPSSILSKLKARFLTPIYTILSVAYVPIPDIFLCLVLWTGVTVLFRLDVDYSIKVVGPIPTGLPNVVWPPAMSVMSSWEAVVPLLWPSFLMALVIYVMSLAVAKHFGKQFDYEIDADQEMRAIGLGSLIGSCFGGYACTGNLTRSAILAQTGARTPLATMVSCGVVLMTLLWWTSLIERVPETVLAAVVLVSLQTLIIQAVEARGLWRVGRRMDAVIWWTTFTTVMIFSIEIGLAVGMLVVVLYQVKKHIRGWKQALCQSVFCQRILLILGLQSPLHTSSSRGWHAGDDDDDY